MNDKGQTARREDPTDMGSLMAALRQAQEVVYTMPNGIVTDELAYSSPAFQQASEELREIREAAEAAIADLDPEVLSGLPAGLLAAVRNSMNSSELSQHLATLHQAAEMVATGKESQLHRLHADLMSPEQRMAHFWHRIEEAVAAIDESIDALVASGDLDAERAERWRRERDRLDALDESDPERIRGERALAQEQEQWATARIREQEANGQPVSPQLVDLRDNAGDIVKSADEITAIQERSNDEFAAWNQEAPLTELDLQAEQLAAAEVMSDELGAFASPVVGAPTGPQEPSRGAGRG